MKLYAEIEEIVAREQVAETGILCVRYRENYTADGVWFDKCLSRTDIIAASSPKYFEYGDILFAITEKSIEDTAKSCACDDHEKCLTVGNIVV